MAKRARRTHNPGFKAKVAMAAVKDEKTLAGGQFKSHQIQAGENAEAAPPARGGTVAPGNLFF